MIYYRIEPFGARINSFGHATTAAAILNVNREKGSEPISPEDLMPMMEEEQEQTVEEQMRIAAMLTLGLGGKDLRDGG